MHMISHTYLGHGIYPSWVTIVKMIYDPLTEKEKRFAKQQEACMKDVERVSGLLKARWAIVRHPARTWNLQTMWE
jgi:hypothetical protein